MYSRTYSYVKVTVAFTFHMTLALCTPLAAVITKNVIVSVFGLSGEGFTQMEPSLDDGGCFVTTRTSIWRLSSKLAPLEKWTADTVQIFVHKMAPKPILCVRQSRKISLLQHCSWITQSDASMTSMAVSGLQKNGSDDLTAISVSAPVTNPPTVETQRYKSFISLVDGSKELLVIGQMCQDNETLMETFNIEAVDDISSVESVDCGSVYGALLGAKPDKEDGKHLGLSVVHSFRLENCIYSVVVVKGHSGIENLIGNRSTTYLMRSVRTGSGYEHTNMGALGCKYDNKTYTEATAATWTSVNGTLRNSTLYVVMFYRSSSIRVSSVLCAFAMDEIFEQLLPKYDRKALINISDRNEKVVSILSTVIRQQNMLVLNQKTEIRLLAVSRTKAEELMDLYDGDSASPDAVLSDIRDMNIAPAGDDLTVMTKSQVIRFDLNYCDKRQTCSECVKDRDEFCGWCVLENRCTFKQLCHTATAMSAYALEQFFLRTIENDADKCPTLNQLFLSPSRAIDSNSWHMEPNQVEFFAENYPRTGSYLSKIKCQFKFSTGELPKTIAKYKNSSSCVNLPPSKFVCPWPNKMQEKGFFHNLGSANSTVEVTVGYLQESSLFSPLRSVKLLLFNCSALICNDCHQTHGQCHWATEKGHCQPSETDNCGPSQQLHQVPNCPHEFFGDGNQTHSLPEIAETELYTANELNVASISPTSMFLSGAINVTLHGAFLNTTGWTVHVGAKICNIIEPRSFSTIVCTISKVDQLGTAPVMLKIANNSAIVPCSNCNFIVLADPVSVMLLKITEPDEVENAIVAREIRPLVLDVENKRTFDVITVGTVCGAFFLGLAVLMTFQIRCLSKVAKNVKSVLPTSTESSSTRSDPSYLNSDLESMNLLNKQHLRKVSWSETMVILPSSILCPGENLPGGSEHIYEEVVYTDDELAVPAHNAPTPHETDESEYMDHRNQT